MTLLDVSLERPAGRLIGPGDDCPEFRVIGLGNTLRADDGAGVRTVEALRESGDLDALPVVFLDGGTLNFTLLEHFSRRCPLIIVDAAEMGCEAGTVEVFEGAEMDRFLRKPRAASVHEASIAELCDMARLAGRLPERRAMIGIQPLELRWTTTLSDPVQDAVRRAARAITRLIGDWL